MRTRDTGAWLFCSRRLLRDAILSTILGTCNVIVEILQPRKPSEMWGLWHISMPERLLPRRGCCSTLVVRDDWAVSGRKSPTHHHRFASLACRGPYVQRRTEASLLSRTKLALSLFFFGGGGGGGGGGGVGRRGFLPSDWSVLFCVEILTQCKGRGIATGPNIQVRGRRTGKPKHHPTLHHPALPIRL